MEGEDAWRCVLSQRHNLKQEEQEEEEEGEEKEKANRMMKAQVNIILQNSQSE